RVDGHTDVRPINSLQFRNNWELSVARAISVVQYLISKGISPQRLVAAGFGEFQPIDPHKNEEAFGCNRRLELKLTERGGRSRVPTEEAYSIRHDGQPRGHASPL